MQCIILSHQYDTHNIFLPITNTDSLLHCIFDSLLHAWPLSPPLCACSLSLHDCMAASLKITFIACLIIQSPSLCLPLNSPSLHACPLCFHHCMPTPKVSITACLTLKFPSLYACPQSFHHCMLAPEVSIIVCLPLKSFSLCACPLIPLYACLLCLIHYIPVTEVS